LTPTRALIQFDEDTYNKSRHRAYEQKRSISSVVGELIAKGLEPGKRKQPRRVDQFSFIGSGRSKQGRLSPVSERHDEALAEINLAHIPKK